MIKCSKCGYENENDARFCNGCGEKISSYDKYKLYYLVASAIGLIAALIFFSFISERYIGLSIFGDATFINCIVSLAFCFSIPLSKLSTKLKVPFSLVISGYFSIFYLLYYLPYCHYYLFLFENNLDRIISLINYLFSPVLIVAFLILTVVKYNSKHKYILLAMYSFSVFMTILINVIHQLSYFSIAYFLYSGNLYLLIILVLLMFIYFKIFSNDEIKEIKNMSKKIVFACLLLLVLLLFAGFVLPKL